MMRSSASLLLSLATLLLPGARASAEDVSPIATHVVTTTLRTLRDCPLKRVITTPEQWARVVDGLEGAPPAPDFEEHVVVLLVTDVSGGALTRLAGLRLGQDGALRVELEREEPVRFEPTAVTTLRCFFLVVPWFPGGVHLDYRTLVGVEGSGRVQRPMPAAPLDRDPARLPSLGPDLRLSYAMADGSPAPTARVLLRQESVFKRQDLTGRVQTIDLPSKGLSLAFPRLGAELRYVFAAHTPGLRSVKPLIIDGLPPDGPDGNPAPITFRFLLEPVQGGGGGR